MNRNTLLIASLPALLGATQTLTQAGTIAACMLTMNLAHQALLSPVRARLSGPPYWAASLLLLAALASCLQLSLRAWALPLALSLGYFPALVCLQCLAVDQHLPAEGRWRALLVQNTGLILACLVLGGVRQGLAEGLGVQLASHPAGALLLLGLLLALYNGLRPGPAPSRRQGTR
ncbi:NADH:quinone oxidoreductase [Pantoea sp. Tr-811]|uniref:Rnf-Nqr domain containing protein n=1 Tax=Pantoea sp. Tr-811 TaxID=2608361 RepID=UPI00141F888C|nr:Rnf-Nqr domain containing protein [Pantoea sp. Tr-811]NIF25791.1 NADH:quinone oxidoreductase [Pantoea sp. Tr-811]